MSISSNSSASSGWGNHFASEKHGSDVLRYSWCAGDQAQRVELEWPQIIAAAADPMHPRHALARVTLTTRAGPCDWNFAEEAVGMLVRPPVELNDQGDDSAKVLALAADRARTYSFAVARGAWIAAWPRFGTASASL